MIPKKEAGPWGGMRRRTGLPKLENAPVQVCTRVPPAVHDRWVAEAEAANMSLSNYVGMLLRHAEEKAGRKWG